MDVLDALQKRLVDACVKEEAAGNIGASHSAESASSTSPDEAETTVASQPRASTTPRSSTSTAPSVGAREPLRLSASSETSTGHRTSHNTMAAREPKVSVEECLECLLVVRGLLYAALLKAGPDTSILWEPNFKNAIIKVM